MDGVAGFQDFVPLWEEDCDDKLLDGGVVIDTNIRFSSTEDQCRVALSIAVAESEKYVLCNTRLRS